MTVTQDSLVLLDDYVTERQRTTSSGTKSRFTISVKSEPIVFNFDEVALGVHPAAAIKKVIGDQIKAITETVSASTELARKHARTAFVAGKSWAKRRYSGGKTGPTPPTDSSRAFNNSGRLANGLFVRLNPSEREFTINVTANRLDPSTFRDRGTFVTMLERLRALVPALRDPASLVEDPKVQAAVRKAYSEILIKKQEQGARLGTEVIKGVADLAKNIADLVQSFDGGE